MDARLFTYFPMDPGQDIYLRCLTARIFILKNCQPPSSQLTVRPLKKRDQFQPFPNSTECHTKYLAMPHGLWPSENKKNNILSFQSLQLFTVHTCRCW